MRTCSGIMVKSGEPCDRPAQSMSPFCGYHSKQEAARRSRDASRQWASKRLMAANEIAAELVATHKMSWCRARLFHALAGAHEQGVLVEVLDEFFADSELADRLDKGMLAAIAGNALRRWPASDRRTKEGASWEAGS